MPTASARTVASADMNQPTQRAMNYIKNKNNITETRLRQQLQQYDREKASSMYNIDHDRLDVKDFLKDVKYCHSDQLPESKLWLGSKTDRGEYLTIGRRGNETMRNAFTAPGNAGGNNTGGANSTSGGGPEGAQRDIKTAPGGGGGGATVVGKKDQDMVQFGIFLAKKTEINPNKVHQDIYSRRNMYSSIERDSKTNQRKEEEEKEKEEQRRKWLEEQEKAAKEEAERKERERKEQEDKLRRERELERQKMIEAKRAAMLAEEKEQNGEQPGVNIKAEMRRIANVREPTEMEKREAQIRAMNANADLMKEILMKNAKKRAEKKKKRSAPIDGRIREFLTNIDLLKTRQRAMESEEPTVEQRRRYIFMTKGLKAAVEFTAKIAAQEEAAAVAAASARDKNKNS